MRWSWKLKLLLFCVFTLAAGLSLHAQEQSSTESPIYKEPSPIPILTGYSGFQATFQPGQQQLQPVIAPIILLPLGRRVLIEGEGEFEGEYTKTTGQPWVRHWSKGLEYLQANIFVNRDLTVVGGRFLTPFGIFNERLHPFWIKNVFINPIVTALEMDSSTGGMLRGGIRLAPDLNINYAAFFSAASTLKWADATRAAGGRFSIFLPNERLEIGTSFKRQLQDEHFNTYGADITWQAKKVPLDLRGEYVRNRLQGSGYWLEGAYRLRQVSFARPFFRKSQAVVRMEQFFVPKSATGGEGDSELPDVSTQRVLFGWNYYFTDALKIGASYGRSFSSERDHNLWTIGIAYRWMIPLGGTK